MVPHLASWQLEWKWELLTQGTLTTRLLKSLLETLTALRALPLKWLELLCQLVGLGVTLFSHLFPLQNSANKYICSPIVIEFTELRKLSRQSVHPRSLCVAEPEFKLKFVYLQCLFLCICSACTWVKLLLFCISMSSSGNSSN